jgi:hypothetical protein
MWRVEARWAHAFPEDAREGVVQFNANVRRQACTPCGMRTALTVTLLTIR